MLTFVHASDLHLGAAFEGIRTTSPDAAAALSESTYVALETVVRIAREESAAFVLLAGDLCNRADGNLRAELALRKAARRLHEEGIALFVVYGNHDYLAPGRPDLDWPETTCVFPAFDAEPRTIESGNGAAFVFGLSYSRPDETGDLSPRFPTPPKGVFSIGLLHAACGSVGAHAPYAPCTPSGLASLGYDYWALGHVHRQSILREAAPVIAYSGCAQGLNPNEAGPRGCNVVRVSDDRTVTLEFRETDAVRWHVEEVDIGDMHREQDLVDALETRLAELAARLDGGRSGLVRFRLAGRGDLHAFLGKTGTAQKLSEHLLDLAPELAAPVWTESVQIATRPGLDLDVRAQTEDFLGDLLRIADEAAGDRNRLSEMLEALKRRLSVSHARTLDAVGVGLDKVGSEEVERWLRQAATLGADMLLRAEE